MQQYLRLHALGDTFSNTVQKARQFAATNEVPKTRKSVRITTPPAHEAVQMIQEDPSLHKRIDKLEDMIRSLQVTSRANTPPLSAYLCNRTTSATSPYLSGEVRGDDQRQPKNNNRRQFIRPFNADINQQRQTRQTETNPSVGGNGISSGRRNPNQNLVRAGMSGGRNAQRPPGVPPGVCWVCRQPTCHSRFHEANSQPTPSPWARSPDVCWTCGQQGCRTCYHSAPRPITPPVPLMSQNLGNASGTRRSGNRGPTQSARSTSN